MWTKRYVEFEGHELSNEINEKIFLVKLSLMDFTINMIYRIKQH